MGSEPSSAGLATADVIAARRRSEQYGINPGATEIPHLGEPGPAADEVLQLSAPVLDNLLTQIPDSPLAVVLADHNGRLMRRDAPQSATLTAMDQRSLDLGFSLAETDVGTNGVGTSLETRKPTIIVGANHFLECFHDFTCANAPIIQPVTGRVEGTVGVMCPATETGPLLLPTAMQLAAQIGELLLEQATPEERFLLEQFLRRRTSPRDPVATIGPDVVIATPAAKRMLADVDHHELWRRIEAGTRRRDTFTTAIERPSSPPLHLRCRPLHRGGQVEGAVVEFVAEARTAAAPKPARRLEQLGTLVGTSDAWLGLVRDALAIAHHTEPVLVVGERGTGRRSIAAAIAEHGGQGSPQVLSAADIVLDGNRAWLVRAQAALAGDTPVVFHRIDQFPDDICAALASLITDSGARLFATTASAEATAPGLAALIDQLAVFQIDVPPLRNRRADIGPLVRHFAAQHGRYDTDQQLESVLYRQPWPGNVTQLDQVLRSADARAATKRLAVHHLPRRIRQENRRQPLHGLRQLEADAIVAAIDATRTRDEAAKQLGISRATLFRRIKAYGLDIDRQ